MTVTFISEIKCELTFSNEKCVNKRKKNPVSYFVPPKSFTMASTMDSQLEQNIN